ncbi:MAG: S-adenosylmethionine:tRNA ribosyltransferase-isomerase [Bacteroidota bacterium]
MITDYNLDAYDFDLPDDLIAQEPARQRDQSRLLVVDTSENSGAPDALSDTVFSALPTYLREEATKPPTRSRDPTTSFLTAATLIYASGAGITAAAGTRLALHLILVEGFKLRPFRLRSLVRVPHRY